MAIQQAVVKGTLASAVQFRNIYVADVVPIGGDSSEDLWYAYLASIYGTINPYISSLANITTTALYHRTGDQWFFDSEMATPWPGESAGEMMPNFVAAVILGLVTGSHSRGRKFFSGWIESAVNGNILITAPLAALVTAALNYVSPYEPITGSILTPGIIDKTGTFRPFTSGVVASLLGTMRRRKPGLGI